MKELDYATDARWFVTVCTHERRCTLGKIVEEDGECVVKLSEIGKIVEEELLRTSELRQNVFIDEYVIMPNHIHVLLEIIGNSPTSEDTNDDENAMFDRRGPSTGSGQAPRDSLELLGSCRGTARRAPTNPDDGDILEKFGKPTHHSLPTVIRSFKSAVTKRVHELRHSNEPLWQRNYWEHGVRTDAECDRIRNYIKENPLFWNEDDENPENLSKAR